MTEPQQALTPHQRRTQRYKIRAAHPGEAHPLCSLLDAAAGMFATIGMAEVANVPCTTSALAPYLEANRAWVITATHELLGCMLLDELDGDGFNQQVSVEPRYARRGLGRLLIEHAENWARERGLAGLALTTFKEVPWNAPYYARLGFRELPQTWLGPEIAARLQQERKDPAMAKWPRIAMRLELRSSSANA